MKMPAYDECYLDSMLQKGRYLFKLIGRNSDQAFDLIKLYMNGEYRGYMDDGNPLYLNKTPKQILGNMQVEIRNLEEISEIYDEFILEWMADIYTYMQWKYNYRSSDIVKAIDPEALYSKYYPLHETSVEVGVEKLKEIYLKQD